MNSLVWFMGGVIACMVFMLILALVLEIADNLGHRKFERIVEEYEKKLKEKDTECFHKIEMLKGENEEHTRICLAEQKEQIEKTEKAAREYQSARFEEERVRLADENFDSGLKQGRNEMMEKLRKGVQSGEIIINRGVDKH